MSRKETERTKLIQEKCQTLLTQMLRDEDNKYCVDCDAKGPRWASWNLGVFLCIRCAGIHRNLGVHISRVKSVNLDTWTPEQVISLQQMGNSRARAVYEAQLPDGFRRPQTDTALESFIRAKYEHKKYLAREWVPPPPPKVDWAKEIDEELERQKRKKKAAQACSALGISSSISSNSSSDKKSNSTNSNKTTPLPAPLPKPKPGQCGSSPKTHRISSVSLTSATAAASAIGSPSNANDHTNDLLGLASPTKPIQSAVGTSVGGQIDLHNDSFSGFLSAAPTALSMQPQKTDGINLTNNPNANATQQNSLAKEEEDFFNQGSLGGGIGGDKDKSGKMTKDSILALYATAAPPPPSNINPLANHHNPSQMGFGQQSSFGGGGVGGGGPFSGMIGGGFMGGNIGGVAQHQQQQQQQQQQFMTPPNSTSMYNTPVMTAPTAFTTPGMHGAAGSAVFSAQFPSMQQMSGGGGCGLGGLGPSNYAPQMVSGMGTMHGGGGIMATGQPPSSLNLNLMQTQQQQHQQQQQQHQHHSLLGGMMQTQMGGGSGIGYASMPMSLGMPNAGMMATAYQTPNAAAASTGNLNQQFGNLNIGNVWQ